MPRSCRRCSRRRRPATFEADYGNQRNGLIYKMNTSTPPAPPNPPGWISPTPMPPMRKRSTRSSGGIERASYRCPTVGTIISHRSNRLLSRKSSKVRILFGTLRMWDAQQRGESQESLEVAWAGCLRYALCHGHPGHAFHGQDAHAMFSEGKRRRSVLRKTRQGHHPNAGTRAYCASSITSW